MLWGKLKVNIQPQYMIDMEKNTSVIGIHLNIIRTGDNLLRENYCARKNNKIVQREGC